MGGLKFLKFFRSFTAFLNKIFKKGGIGFHCSLNCRKVNKSSKSPRGLTLVEVLLVISMLALIALTLYNAFANGLKVWERAQQYVVEEDIAIFFDKISHDLRNTINYSQFVFEGRPHYVVIPSLILTAADQKADYTTDQKVKQIGKIRYEFDYLSDSIYRSQGNYSQSLIEGYGSKRSLVESIQAVKFRYYYRDSDGVMFESDTIDLTPFGVLIDVEYEDNEGLKNMTKYINIPVGI